MANKLDPSRLEALLESARLLQSSLELDTILRHLLRTVMGRLLARKGLLAVRKSDHALRLELVRGASAMAVGSLFDRVGAVAAGIDRFFPIGPEDEPVGVLGIGGMLSADISSDDSDFIAALLGLAASVISNATAHEASRLANQLLDQRLQELRALLDLGRGLAATLDPDEVARLVGLTLAGRWAVSKYAVVAWKEGQPLVSRQKGLDIPEPAPWRDSLDNLPDAGMAPSPLLDTLHLPGGTLLLPIRSQDKTIGLIACGPRMRGLAYRDADLEFGAGLASQAAVALENAWHFKDTLLKQQLEKELTLAANIQKDLFPKKLPDLARFDLAARNRQAKQVGGDYYDVLPFEKLGSDQPHLLCVADISGKGLPASLLMSNIQATLRALLLREPSLLEVAGRANELLYATTPSNRFATAFLIAVEPVSGQFHYVNCGHNAAVLLRGSGEVEMLDGPGLALGLFPRRTFQELSNHLEPGDVLCVYSDGVTEAQSLDEQEFETDRLIECMRAWKERPSIEIVDHIFGSIDDFVGDAPQFDDITLLIAKRL